MRGYPFPHGMVYAAVLHEERMRGLLLLLLHYRLLLVLLLVRVRLLLLLHMVDDLLRLMLRVLGVHGLLLRLRELALKVGHLCRRARRHSR